MGSGLQSAIITQSAFKVSVVDPPVDCPILECKVLSSCITGTKANYDAATAYTNLPAGQTQVTVDPTSFICSKCRSFECD